ncbi:MAG TPA: outer membrane lipoprotein-sorting protein, partial [Treponemataceae bacterium]|nr:outer membrane lipoprotein-sorting protein [Treponemataceae bacterium]
MKKIILTALVFLSMISLYSLTGNEIIDKVLDTQTVNSSAMDIQMTLINKSGEKSLRRIQTLVLTEDDITKTIT